MCDGGYILLCDDISEAVERLSSGINAQSLRIFHKSNFLKDDVKPIQDEAHLAFSQPARFIIAGKSFNITFQNALLKLFEEPPKNVQIILVATSKSIFLRTVRSRFPIIDERTFVPLATFPLDVSRLSLQDSYRFLKELENRSKAKITKKNQGEESETSIDDTDSERLQKDGVRELISSLLLACHDANIPLKESDFAIFERAIFLADIERAENLFIPLLLLVMQRKKDVRSKN